MDFFSFFRQPTDEEVAAMQEAHDRQHMAIEEFKHGSQRLFEELDLDQLKTLQSMLHIINGRTGDSLVSLWEGIVSATLKHKFNICITCGVNHDEEVFKHPEEIAETNQVKRPLTEAEKFFSTPEEIAEAKTDDDTPLPIFFGSLTPEQLKLMEEYHLDDVYDADTQQLLHFACTGIEGMNKPCGVNYPTIEDRMLKGPEECSGCFQRMMHG